MILPLSDDRYEIFTTDLLKIEVCQNAVLSKIDITMSYYGDNQQKTSKSIKAEFCAL